MRITFECPDCRNTADAHVDCGANRVQCPHCGTTWTAPPDAWAGSTLRRCLVCPSEDLFIRKDFPQRIGVTIVVIGFAASCVAWYYYQPYITYGILLATALIDLLLYTLMPEALVCYRCGAHYRGAGSLDQHSGFNLETHERYRQQAARMKT